MAGEIEIILEDEPKKEVKVKSTKELMDKYNTTKSNSSMLAANLSGDYTLGGMESVNSLVSEAMIKIKDFVDNGKEKGFVSKTTSKALAVVDPGNKWAGKWFNNASDRVEEEKLKEKSINEVVDTLIKQIEDKRDTVVHNIEKLAKVKSRLEADKALYTEIRQEAQTQMERLIEEGKQNTKEYFDAEFVEVMCTTSIKAADSDIKSQVDPLIAGARISVTQVNTMLPSIENDLKYKSGFKAFQQELSDFNGIVKTTTQLASEAGDIIRKDVNDTIYDSLKMIGENGLDADRIAKIEKEEIEHQKQIDITMTETEQKIKATFGKIRSMSETLEHKRSEARSIMLESYSK